MNNDERSGNSGLKESPRIGLVVLLIIIGSAITITGSLLASTDDYWAGVLANTGSAVILASAIVLIEKHFFRQVAASQSQASEETSSKLVGQAEKRLEARLATIDDRLNKYIEKTDLHADKILDKVLEEQSFESIRDALQTASDLNAIGSIGINASTQLIVPAGNQSNSPRIGFSYTPAGQHDWEPWSETIYLAFLPEYTTDSGLQIQWAPDETFETALGNLLHEMRRNNEGPAAHRLTEPSILITNLHTALRLAVASRRGEPQNQLHGNALAELLWNEDTVTEIGLQSKDAGNLLIDGHKYPARTDAVPSFTSPWQPTRPKETALEDWESISQITRSHFYLRGETY
jgi:hypothetical protein